MYPGAILLFLMSWAMGVWETKPPEEWTVEEVRDMFDDSPWSRTLRSKGEPLQVHLASAVPMREAEKRQRAFQKRVGANSVTFDEYLALVDEGKYIVLAVRVKDRDAFSDGVLLNRMQKDSKLRVNKKEYALTTYFPPSSTDPYLRLVFPRVAAEKSVDFVFVMPGAQDPYRQVSFFTKGMVYKGKTEY